MDGNYINSSLKPYRNSALIMPGPRTIHEVRQRNRILILAKKGHQVASFKTFI